MPGYLDAIDVNIREKKRESVDIEYCNYRHQIGKKFRLDKAYRYKKKVDRDDVDISGVHCTLIDLVKFFTSMYSLAIPLPIQLHFMYCHVLPSPLLTNFKITP